MTERAKAFPALLERLKPECEKIIAQYERKRSALLPMMHLFQQNEGYVTPEAMNAAAEMLDLTPAEVESTVSFYTLLYPRPVGKYVLQICRGLACSINGAEDMMAYFREKLGIGQLQTTADGLFSYEEVECLAACDRASCMQVNLDFVYDLTPARIDEMLGAMRAGTYATPPMAQTEAPGRGWEIPQAQQIASGTKSPGASGVELPDNAGGVGDQSGIIMLDRIVNHTVRFFTETQERAVVDSRAVVETVEEGNGAGHWGPIGFADGGRGAEGEAPVQSTGVPNRTKSIGVLTAGIGEADLCSIDVYRQRGGYKQWERVLRDLKPADVLDLVEKSGLRGRGGAGFPTGRKWSFLPKDKPLRYLVCNCDEAEPGTFKDHMLLEETPHQIIEGMLIGAYGIASHHAYIYIRGEFRRGYDIFCAALDQARRAGFVGANVLGSGYDLEITVHRGAGAYICGEETAMLNSLEGKRGEPRLKPPFPAVEGLYGEPTVVNNVETLAYIVAILERGPEWFAAAGTERTKGYKVVSVSGHVQKPGNYEVAMGTPVRELIAIAGGLRPGRTLRAVQPGGGSSACIFEEHLDLPYDYESMAKVGSMLGSGAVVVFDDTTDFVKAAHNLARFFAHESCGQCTPCREGGAWLTRVLDRLVHHRGIPGDFEMLSRVSGAITGLNLCPLGDSIEPFLKSVLQRFPDDFKSRILEVQPA